MSLRLLSGENAHGLSTSDSESQSLSSVNAGPLLKVIKCNIAHSSRCITSKLSNIDAELVAFLENTFATLCDEIVESICKASHSLAKVFKAKVDAWQ